MQKVLKDSKAIDRKLRKLMRDRSIELTIRESLSVALTRIENFQEDIQTVIDDAADEQIAQANRAEE